MSYLVLCQALLAARYSVPVSVYKTSFGVDGLEPRISLRMERAAMSILSRLELQAEP